MSVLTPPPQEEHELLIREARARQRKRWLIAAAVLALLAGAALGIDSILGSGSATLRSHGGPTPVVPTHGACGVRGIGIRILGKDGQTLYREPGRYTHPNRGFPTIRCSGSTIWALWFNGAGMSQEAYLGARSLDRGRTWRLVFTEGMFGPKAPHELDAYLGPWALRGDIAYFTGWCPACSNGKLEGTISLWVTSDGGRTFREYKPSALLGYAPVGLRVAGRNVMISARAEGIVPGMPRRKVVRVRTG